LPAAPPGRRPRLGLSLTGVNGQPRAESTGAVGADGLAGAHARFGAGKGLSRPRRSTQFRPRDLTLWGASITVEAPQEPLASPRSRGAGARHTPSPPISSLGERTRRSVQPVEGRMA